jgi:tetratricopeptide (TPR) repeat protein
LASAAQPKQQSKRVQQQPPPQLVAAQKHFAKGLQLAQSNKPDAAIVELQAAKKLMPRQPAILINLGLCYMQKKSFSSAEASFKQTLAIDPKNSFAKLQLVRALMGSNKNSEALSAAKKAASALPKEYDAQFLLGVANLRMKNLSGAIPAFKSAVAIRPKDPGALYDLGYCQINLKKYADARKTYDKFLAIAPDDPQANYLAGVACEQSGDKAAAIHRYENAAWKDAPASKTAIMNLARLYEAERKPDESVRILKRAAAKYKTDYDINLSLGRMLSGQSKFKDAQPYLLAAKKASSNPYVNMNLAMNS